MEKSELLGVIVEERRRLAEIVDRSSDGIFTGDRRGRIESWNPAMEAMTGIGADHIVGERGLARLLPQGADGEPVLVESWSTAGIPSAVQLSTDAGERWLGCSTAVGGGGGTLVVAARGVTRAPIGSGERRGRERRDGVHMVVRGAIK